MIKSAVMVFSKDAVNGCWKWGEHSLPKVSSYSYLGIDFSSNGAWDMHIKKLLDNGRKKVNQLHKVISNRNVNLSARRLLLLSVIRPSIEYGSEVWEGNKSQGRIQGGGYGGSSPPLPESGRVYSVRTRSVT